MSRISVCAIVKNEEKTIERMLESVQPYGFEIVVVDTGSTDGTKEIVSRYTDKIHDFEWCDDFSAARNFAAARASNDWILMMDADEWIESLDLEELRYFMKKYPDCLGSVFMDNETGTPDRKGPVSRIHIERFYNRRKFHYISPIHEMLAPRHKGVLFENLQLNSVLGHSGYCMDEETRKKKAERNIGLLLKQLSDDPSEEDIPYILYQLGKGYQMTGDDEEACARFGKALEYDLDPELDYVNDLVVQYGNELLLLKRYEEALSFEGIREAFEKTADFVYLMGRIYLVNEKYQQAADEFQKALTIRNYRLEGTNSYLPAFELGKLLLKANQPGNARVFLKMCGNYPPAVKLLNETGRE
ncbi:MAG: glycosyltransferase [Lachnospiraceae bacterium]|nr:glycosyltransferase [Lachnospiraceae bacterium]